MLATLTSALPTTTSSSSSKSTTKPPPDLNYLLMPGPYLPSLDSLNLTTWDLHNLAPRALSHLSNLTSTHQKRGGGPSSLCSPEKALNYPYELGVACLSYLFKIGDQQCPLLYNNVELCNAKSHIYEDNRPLPEVHVIGTAESKPPIHAPCMHVAMAIFVAMHKCMGVQVHSGRTDIVAAGDVYAYGSYNYRVTVYGDYPLDDRMYGPPRDKKDMWPKNAPEPYSCCGSNIK
ncbi:hypothetical protein DL546_006287 [Coniochaeta pulveracea]|uniref:Uncharacterized protein n=1 Tax=Coniochaeta pulveracea TaxID=177199 RepID=A0A420Y496_9PEZI|nr:hypothetical protein DL546_006287 [Coniochaeta pulveracea]